MSEDRIIDYEKRFRDAFNAIIIMCTDSLEKGELKADRLERIIGICNAQLRNLENRKKPE